MTTDASSSAAALFANAFKDPIHEAFLLEGGNKGALLVHGFPGTPAEMRPLGKALHEAGWTVRGILLPGFGKDIVNLEKRGHDDWLTAVCNGIAEMQARHEIVIVVGHSMGGALALEAAATRQPDGVVLLAPFWKLNHALWTALPALKYAIPSFKPFRLMKVDFHNPQTRQGITNFMPEVNLDDPAVQAGIRDFAVPTRLLDQIRVVGANAYKRAPEVNARTFILQGSRDELVPTANTQALAARIPNATLRMVSGDHNLVERASHAYPDVERLTLAFADELWETRRAAS